MNVNLSDKLFNPEIKIGDETAIQIKERIENNARIFKAALNNQAGREFISLLTEYSHPLAPRYDKGLSIEQAAYLDGEKTLIGLMWLNGTMMKEL